MLLLGNQKSYLKQNFFHYMVFSYLRQNVKDLLWFKWCRKKVMVNKLQKKSLLLTLVKQKKKSLGLHYNGDNSFILLLYYFLI